VGVSRPWKPDDRRKWAVFDAYAPAASPHRGIATVTLVLGAVFAGLVGGAAWQRWSALPASAPSAAIEWDAVQKAPKRVLSADEIAWEERGRDSSVIASGSEAIQPGLPRASGARNDAVRAAFSYCKWGGGTNCVVDGDTFYIGGEKVRIAGIDAPETHPSRCADEARLGNAATEQLHALLNSGAVTMTPIDRDRDRYGRLLRNVAVNGADVGEAMISAGVARQYGQGRRSWC
jgi:endonuclease YncB( thermonuclease family)